MEQHPIPQHISSYEFRLVGDMTLKQFFQLAGGAVISLLIYSLPIHPIIKWPFIIFFSLLGAALAFLPFEERPLERWIIAFFRSVYSPTSFTWKKEVPPPEIFSPESLGQQPVIVQEEAFSGTSVKNPVSNLESLEKGFLSKLTDVFSSTGIPTGQPALAVVQTNPANTQKFVVPATETVAIPKMTVEEQFSIPNPTSSEPLTTSAVGETLTGQEVITTIQSAQFSLDAAPPSPPSQPNTITGQVIDPEGHIVEGAILELKDEQGRPVRALRTNKAGHFMIVTPLLNGKYELITDKEGLIFESLAILANGSLVPPIAVKAKSRQLTSQVVN